MFRKLLPPFIVAATAANLIALGFLANGSINKSSQTMYLVAAASTAKQLTEEEKEQLSSLAQEIWHQKVTQAFRCTYSQNPTCVTTLEGKPFQVSLSQEVSQKLMDQTKGLWEVEGFKSLSHIDCILGEDAKCQVAGSLLKKPAELSAGQCLVEIQKG